MKTRIFLAGLYGAGLLYAPLPAAAMRAEISVPLQQAKVWESRGSLGPAMSRLRIAEAVPNQTHEEKDAVAKLKTLIVHDMSRQEDQSYFGQTPVAPPQNVLPPNYSPNPPDQTPNVPHPY
jgi:hypothetical protein